MKRIKKILKVSAIILFLLIGTAFALPYIFKGKILNFAKKEINERLNAKADFKDISISLFRQFPRASVAIDGFQITGSDVFEKDTLLQAQRIEIVLNLLSLIKGTDYTIYKIDVDAPSVRALVTKDGIANWDIIKPASSDTATKNVTPFKMKLQSYTIHNGSIYYEDKASNIKTELLNLNHTGKGDFTDSQFILQTHTDAAAVTINYGGIKYLSAVKTIIDTDIDVNNNLSKYSFNTKDIRLNDLQLNSNGFFQILNDSVYKMDIGFKAPAADFKSILSLLPVIYTHDFANIETKGNAAFTGFVKGIYSNTALPAYQLNLDINDGYFKYPDLPKPVKNIFVKALIENPDGVTDHTTIDISKAHIEFDNDPFDFRLLLQQPLTAMNIDAAANGKIYLDKLTQFIKLEKDTRLKGLLDAAVTMKGSIAALEKGQYENFDAGGTVYLSDFLYASVAYPEGIALKKLQSSFTPKNLVLNEVSGTYLQTNFTANGAINNLLPYVLKKQPLDCHLTIKADKLDLNQWMGTTSDTTTQGTAAAKPFAVPANIHFVLDATADEVIYDKLVLQQLNGTLEVANETITLTNIQSAALDGSIKLNGSYSTAESKEHPAIKLFYDLKELDVQKTFYAFNTFQQLMPVGKFIAGKLNSQLSFTGKLGENMMPDLNSLTGNGNLLLIQGFLSKFQPLEKLAQTLNIAALQQVAVKDIKNYIEFTNGQVLVKPFKVKVNDIEMEIGGMHGFTQAMNYTILMKVPRAMMGEKGNAYINNLAMQASNKGVPVKLSDIVNLTVTMTGDISNPTIKTDIKQTATSLAEDLKQQAAAFAKAKADSTKNAVTKAVKDTATAIKNQAIDMAKKELINKLNNTKDSSSKDSKKIMGESAKGLIENLNLFKKKKKPVKDSIKQQ